MVHNLIPHFIQENFALGNYRDEFSAAGLFVDISGFTSMTEALMKHGPHGAELLAIIMRNILDPPIHYVYEQGGFITGLAGDAFTALFPYQKSAADASWQALAAAWRIQEHINSHSVHTTPSDTFRISAKVGLTTGDVTWGILTSLDGDRAAYYFQGTAVDGCAAAEHQAGPGEIILDAEIFKHVRDGVTVEALANHQRLSAVTGKLPAPQEIDLPAPNLEILKLFFPAAIVTQTHSGEFRQLINLFINLPTVRTEAQLGIFMQSLFELQKQYGGLFNRLDFGDKGSNLLLFWGTPLAHENDVERALNFILDLQTRSSIPINAGITYRMSHAGFVGSPLREDYTGYGQGVNLAARFMTTAPRGEIWVDEQVARRAQAGFDLEFEAEMTFKGINERQRVYVLYERKEEVEALYAVDMVGRRAELEELTELIAPLWQGNCAGTIVIRGEPGIGKSRLVHEFKSSSLFEEHESLWALCQCDEILRGSLNPFSYWLKRYFGQSEALNESRNKRSFNHKLDNLIRSTARTTPILADELDRTRSFLGALVGLRWPDSLYEQLDPQGRYENSLIALTTLLQAESLEQPVIMFLEDAQWLDGDSRMFLASLSRSITSDDKLSYPIAIIATSRQEQREDDFGQALISKEIHLVGITDEDLAQLAGEILGGDPSPELLQELTARAEGNPFFAEQILRYLQEESHIKTDQQGLQTVTVIDPSRLPTDVMAVLVARLDRLAQEVKQVVQTAAVLGREFEVQLLARMLQYETDLSQIISTAEQASVWMALNELRYLFKHGLLRDAAYHMQVLAQRQTLHALAVEALEHLYGDEGLMDLPAGGPSHYGELAYHCEQAQLAEKARRYASLAGKVARDVYQNALAVDYFSQALRLTPEDDLENRYNSLLEREALYNLLGDREAQSQDLTALTQLADKMTGAGHEAHQAEVWSRQADYAMHTGDYLQADTASERAIALAKESDALEIAAQAYLTWASTLWRRGEYSQGSRQAEAGLILARQIEDYPGQSRLLNMLGIIALEQNEIPRAQAYLEDSLLIARQANDRRIEAMLLNSLGNLSGNMGDFTTAQGHYQQAHHIAREIGDRNGEGRVLGNLGWIAGTLGDYASARSYCERNLRIAHETGDRSAEVIALINLSSYSVWGGDQPAALDYAQKSMALARTTGDRSGEAWALTYLGHAQSESRQLTDAARNYQAALEIRQNLGQPNLAAEPLAGLARIAMANEDIPSAQEYILPILTHLDSGETLEGTDEQLRVFLTCYHVLQAAGDPRATPIITSAYDLLQEQAARISDERTRHNFLENITYHKEIVTIWKNLSAA